MTYNFEFIIKIKELSNYYNDFEELELLFAKKCYTQCFCKSKQIIEKITLDTAYHFNIYDNKNQLGDSYSRYWHGEEWDNFFDDIELEETIKTLIWKRNRVEHRGENATYDNAFHAIYIVKLFVLRISELYGYNITYNDDIVIPQNEDEIIIKQLQDQNKKESDERTKAEQDTLNERQKHEETKEQLRQSQQNLINKDREIKEASDKLIDAQIETLEAIERADAINIENVALKIKLSKYETLNNNTFHIENISSEDL